MRPLCYGGGRGGKMDQNMILNQRETTVAYRCPVCGGGVLSLVGVFALTADVFKLKCPCGESELVISYTTDKKIRLSVPCIICQQSHNYVIISSLFFGKELFVLGCSFLAIDLCFIGNQDSVSEALSQSEKELLELLGELGIESLEDLRYSNENLLPDAQIFDIVLFVVRELEAEGNIHCNCDDGRYDVEITHDSIRVFCKNCKAENYYPADSINSANAFLNCECLVLS